MWGVLLLVLGAGSEITVDSTVACPDGPAVLRALLACAEPLRTVRPARLQVTAAGPMLVVRLEDGEGHRLEERRLSRAKISCEELAQTIALLTQAWLAELPFLTNGAVPSPAFATLATDGGVTGPDAGVDGGVRDAGPSAAGPDAGPPVIPSPSSPLTLGVRAAGAGAIGMFPGSFGGGAALVADLGIGRHLDLGLEGAWLTDLSTTDPVTGDGAVVHRQRFGGFAGWTLGRGGPQWLTLQLGLDDSRLEASAHGYKPSGSAAEDDPVLTFGAAYSRLLAWRLFAFGSAQFATAFVRQAFQVTQGNAQVTLVELPALELDLSIGLGLRLF